MADEIEIATIENAQGSAKAAGDSGSMEHHPLPAMKEINARTMLHGRIV
jgi:hypothetical protein